ncbi:hypothetical protein WH47_12132 [Habropoda laboriosa]|uniref:Uncharacterized protein n=1 Tax=Habropoda laboriosa TaxID=597456 RepID=A0A0L7RA91_9HYME|nr:PREDICTED: uncharacterized protein LOC108580217 [Habropoda laboriosa]KOC67802.1 hypothetical protein WH47_12132 [Habropoda laboriosa]
MRLLFWCILCFTLITAGKLEAAARATRSLAFRKGSVFFYRVNYKITTLPNSTIFAHAAGFKLVWELPSGAAALRKGRSVSDVHQAAELVYESHGFNGRSCLLKNICSVMEYVSQRDGVLAKILKLLLGSYTSNSSPGEPLYCDVHVRNCPLELIGIDGFMEQ